MQTIHGAHFSAAGKPVDTRERKEICTASHQRDMMFTAMIILIVWSRPCLFL